MNITTDKKNMVVGNNNHLKGKPMGLNDSIVIMSGANSNKKEPSQRKSIQSIVNQAFDDGVVNVNNDSQLSG